MSLLAETVFHIFPCALVYTKDHHAKLYQISWTNGGISEILLPFTIFFKMAQYVLGAVFGSLRLLARRSWYFNLEELIALDISSVRAFEDV